jgi:hypothetical protein
LFTQLNLDDLEDVPILRNAVTHRVAIDILQNLVVRFSSPRLRAIQICKRLRSFFLLYAATTFWRLPVCCKRSCIRCALRFTDEYFGLHQNNELPDKSSGLFSA